MSWNPNPYKSGCGRPMPPNSPKTRQITGPQPPDIEIDPNKTSFLSQVIRRWGKLPLNCLNGLDMRRIATDLLG